MTNKLIDIELITFAPSATVAIAQNYGFFKEEGLNVLETRTPSSSVQMKGLIDETYQFASTAFDNVLAWSKRILEGLYQLVGASLDIVFPEVSKLSDFKISLPILTSLMGSSDKETLTVSPIPSIKSKPRPIDVFTLPGTKLPDSVTPKCKG